MPAKGGAAGKAGDQYEALWTVDAALRVIAGRAEYVTYESLDPEQSRGVEFSVQTSTGDLEFWSLKRQTSAAAGWTLAALVKRDAQGRSILDDLKSHVERDSRNVAVFASTLGAARLEEIRSVAMSADTLRQRLNQSKDLSADFDNYLLPLFDGDSERTRKFLTRLQIRTADETSLRTQTESFIALLVYPESGGEVDAPAIRRLMAEYLLDHMHQQIDRQMLLEHLGALGFRRKDWKVDATVREMVDTLCESYISPLREQLIGGTLQALPGTEKLLAPDGLPCAKRTLISGGAGGGKSSACARVIDRLRVEGIPVLPVRMDIIDESILTPQRLGKALSLPASPVAVLAGLADGGNCVLVVDQLDAVSLASGRRANVWSLFEQLRTEADAYPNLRVIVACRAFDLEHDHRMRSLAARDSGFEIVTIEAFDVTTVDEILGDREVHPKLRPLLVVPLHLAMFMALTRNESEGLESRDELFASFWKEKQRRCTQRLGRECAFADVVNWLAGWLSDHQELSAPENMLPDALGADADTLASEHVIVLLDRRVRFFHEAFFDHVFARRFGQTGGCLLRLLLDCEQHLFRRAQVRQLLSFLRSSDPHRYQEQLRAVLMDGRVRFHIKRTVLQFLSAATDPMQSEWTVLAEFGAADPDWLNHVNRAVSNHTGWFDCLDAAGVLESGLTSGEEQEEWRTVWLCAMPDVLKGRSARVATLLIKNRRDDDAWCQYLQYACRNGHVFYSRQMFDLFLSLIRDGTLDGTRPGFAVNDNWWTTLYSMSTEAPAMAAEAIAVWLDRVLQRGEQAAEERESLGDETDQHAPPVGLWRHLDADGDDHGVIAKAAGAELEFTEHILPRVADFVAKYARTSSDCLDSDPLWSCRLFGDDTYPIYDSLLKSLARAMEGLARSSPGDLDRLIAPYLTFPHDAITYLLLRAWSAAPLVYSERIARYLTEDPRRLKVGYASSSGDAGEGITASYRSIEAVRVASPSCSIEAFRALEQVIVDLRDEVEAGLPRLRGLRQLRLLEAMDQGRLGKAGHAKLSELRRKFPGITSEPPKPIEVVRVDPPIPVEAQDKMTDEQWLSAMEKYGGVESRQRQLAESLRSKAIADPKRFVALTKRMSTALPASYFEAVLRGVAETPPPRDNGGWLADVVSLIERVHALPKRPSGLWVTYLVGKWSGLEWPPSVVEITAWYATEDPDPTEEMWRKEAPSGQLYHGGDPDMAGLNSTRGSAANAIAGLMYNDRGPAGTVINAVDSLAHDASIAVRSQAIRALLALLRTQPGLAIQWFVECVSADDVLLKTSILEHFVHDAGHHDYAAIRPVLHDMIGSNDVAIVETGSRLCCLLALSLTAAEADAAPLRTGTTEMRMAAATVYATNIAHQEVGGRCRDLLMPFFGDEADIQAKAAAAFRRITELEPAEQERMLEALLDANPSAEALKPVIRAIEDSAVRLPDLVCRLIEVGIEKFKAEAGDIRTHGAMVGSDLSKIVIRLYSQSNDASIKTRCLDAIDAMEQASFVGLSGELERIER